MSENQLKNDRRVDRTIGLLRTALIELMLEKHYDSITVQNIIDRANVGRSTFYTHFRDKEDLLVGDWEKLLGFLAAHINITQAGADRIFPMREFMLHLKDFHAFYRALVKSGKADRLMNLGIEFLAARIEEKLTSMGDNPKTLVPSAITANFIALQTFGTLKWWLDRNMPYSPEEMDRIFNDLVRPGVENALGSGSNMMARAKTSSIL